MSADNTVYIRPMSDGTFCVAVLYSVYPEQGGWDDAEVDEMNRERESSSYTSEDEAWDYANALYDSWVESGEIIEHGVALWPRHEKV